MILVTCNQPSISAETTTASPAATVSSSSVSPSNPAGGSHAALDYKSPELVESSTTHINSYKGCFAIMLPSSFLRYHRASHGRLRADLLVKGATQGSRTIEHYGSVGKDGVVHTALA